MSFQIRLTASDSANTTGCVDVDVYHFPVNDEICFDLKHPDRTISIPLEDLKKVVEIFSP